MAASRALPGLLARASCALLGAALAVLAAEGALRLGADEGTQLSPELDAALRGDPELARQVQRVVRERWKSLEDDRELGARPVFDGRIYGPQGALVNAYPLERAPGVERLLFVGDSVTRRGKLMAALAAELPGPEREWWNGGVEGYGPAQIACYYERYTRAVRPQRVVFSFHNNDFATTPVVFRDEGSLVLFLPQRPSSLPSPWLLRHSRLYRRWTFSSLQGADEEGIAAEVERSVKRLRDDVERDGARFTVFLLPRFEPPELWPPESVRSRERALELLQGLGVETYDLYPPFLQAVAEGVPLSEAPNDQEHPSEELARRFARYLVEQGFPAD